VQVSAGNFLDTAYAAGVPDGKWHMATLTYDAATGVGGLYADGAMVGSGTMGTGLFAMDPMQPFSVGAVALDTGFEGYLTGDVADVVVYDHALTQQEITDLFKGTYASTGMLAHYPTKEGMGLTSADASGNGHTLTVPANGWAMSAPHCP
jgi:hypothetical protein